MTRIQGGTRCIDSSVNFRKSATNYRALSRKITLQDKESYVSSHHFVCSFKVFDHVACIALTWWFTTHGQLCVPSTS